MHCYCIWWMILLRLVTVFLLGYYMHELVAKIKTARIADRIAKANAKAKEEYDNRPFFKTDIPPPQPIGVVTIETNHLKVKSL